MPYKLRPFPDKSDRHPPFFGCGKRHVRGPRRRFVDRRLSNPAAREKIVGCQPFLHAQPARGLDCHIFKTQQGVAVSVHIVLQRERKARLFWPDGSIGRHQLETRPVLQAAKKTNMLDEKLMAERGLNKIILVGYVGHDPRIRLTPSGEAVADIMVGTVDRWKDHLGEQRRRTVWHHVVFFKGMASVVQGFLRKGSKVYVAGRLRFRKWKKDGANVYSAEIIADEMQILDNIRSIKERPE